MKSIQMRTRAYFGNVVRAQKLYKKTVNERKSERSEAVGRIGESLIGEV